MATKKHSPKSLGHEYPVTVLQITLNSLESLVLMHDKEKMFVPDNWSDEDNDNDQKKQYTSMSNDEIDVFKIRINELKKVIAILSGDDRAVNEFMVSVV